MNYDQYILAMQTMLVVPTDGVDNNFQNIVPRMIEYAELRIYRELDFLYTQKADTVLLTLNTRNVTLTSTATSIFIVSEFNIVTPSTATNPDLGTRNPCTRVSLDYMNKVFNVAATTGVPQYYAMLDNSSVRLGPTPDAAYTAEYVGIYRPTPLSPANTSTFITTYLPDLFIAASMVFGSGYQRDFGAQADDARMAQSWEAQYTALRAGLQLEELRRKAQSTGWTSFSPSPVANMPRDRGGAGAAN